MVITSKPPRGHEDPYQGTPSGVPNRRKKEPGFSRCLVAIPARHANPAHVKAGARTFFITSSTWGKQSLLQSDRAAGLFLRVLYDYRAQNKFRLHDFVAMPDHFHVLLTVESGMTIERAVQFIKGGFSFRAGKELGMRSPIWQKGFSEVRITEPEGFLQVRAYIRNNPVARNLVADPQNYPYSSAHPGFELDAVPQGLQNQAGALNLAA
jgi:putative transposase